MNFIDTADAYGPETGYSASAMRSSFESVGALKAAQDAGKSGTLDYLK